MKIRIYIVVVLFLVSCKNITKNNQTKNNFITYTVDSTKNTNYKTDTLVKTSKPFTLNNLLCYWEHFFVIYDYGHDETQLEITMKLKNYKTKNTLLEYSDNPRYSEDYNYKSAAYFDTINVRHFIDLNFDGFKDFKIYSNGSMPMTSMTNIYVFNDETKTFENSDLSDTNIEEVDTNNKILTTSSWGLNTQYTKRHHFGKNGKIKFSEYISEENYSPNDTISEIIKIYKKTINGEEVEIKIDTLRNL